MKHGACLKVPCPTCKSDRGEACRSKEGKLSLTYHAARKKAALEPVSFKAPQLDVPMLEQDLLAALARFVDRRIAVVLGGNRQ